MPRAIDEDHEWIEVTEIIGQLSASEALFGFMAWLTTREKITPCFSCKHDSVPAIDLVAQFCRVNHLTDPRNGWENNLTHPPEPENVCKAKESKENPN